jgi:hypothetical protein
VAIVINFSGHVLSDKTRKILLQKYEDIEELPFVEIDFTDSIEKTLQGVIDLVQTNLDGSIPISLIPPGQATFAILLVTYLHGLLGYFPAVCYLEASSSGQFEPSAIFHIDGYTLRKAGRSYRQEIWNKTSNKTNSNDVNSRIAD